MKKRYKLSSGGSLCKEKETKEGGREDWGVHCLVQVVGEDLVDKGTLETHE